MINTLPVNIEAFMIELDRLSEMHGIKSHGQAWSLEGVPIRTLNLVMTPGRVTNNYERTIQSLQDKNELLEENIQYKEKIAQEYLATIRELRDEIDGLKDRLDALGLETQRLIARQR
jgi:hypothetical protein